MELKEKICNFYDKLVWFGEKYTEPLTILGLAVLFYFIFFHDIGSYSLMDVDETRYVAMARDMFHSKDFLTLYLNGEYFFEKPPLYFWQECLSFALWGGKVNEWTARFPVALLGFLFSFVVYGLSRIYISRRFGVFTSLIIATSLEFIMLARYAILDIVLTFYIGLALVSYFTIYFCKENQKKYFWWSFYIFSGLAVMAKGIPGVAVPFGIVFFTSIMAKKFKNIFKPIYIIPGMILFLLIVLPWHIAMFKMHDPLFFNEYIIKHHLARFFTSIDIDRSEPVWFYFVNLIWGMVPWIFSALAIVAVKCKNFRLEIFKNFKFNFNELDDAKKYLILNWLAAIFILLFFSSSSTKLITYILPVYVHLACILGFAWLGYIESGKYKKAINISVYIWGGFCIFLAVAALFTPLFTRQSGCVSDL